MTTLVVIAKECLPGKVKTRLHPPLSLAQAAKLAEASLHRTLATTLELPASRRILYFDGIQLPVGSEHFDVIPQPTGTLDERIAAIFDACDGPTVLIGMDTPQVSAQNLAAAFPRPGFPGPGRSSGPNETTSSVDAWFGPATDGGFWALGLARPDGSLIRGVPMSRDDTGRIQRARLESAGLTVLDLPTLTDVDDIFTAREVARLIPGSRFAEQLVEFSLAEPDGGTA